MFLHSSVPPSKQKQKQKQRQKVKKSIERRRHNKVRSKLLQALPSIFGPIPFQTNQGASSSLPVIANEKRKKHKGKRYILDNEVDWRRVEGRTILRYSATRFQPFSRIFLHPFKLNLSTPSAPLSFHPVGTLSLPPPLTSKACKMLFRAPSSTTPSSNSRPTSPNRVANTSATGSAEWWFRGTSSEWIPAGREEEMVAWLTGRRMRWIMRSGEGDTDLEMAGRDSRARMTPIRGRSSRPRQACS